MKRIFSLLLVVMLLVSSVPAAYATNDYTAGTKVEYTAENTEAYTITVPASLQPGDEGTVTLSGTWASDRVVTVTADKTVTLTNSINAADQKTLDIGFAGMEYAGDNTQARTYTESVSVAAMPADALFGTWSGKFNYNVGIEDAVIQTPVVFGEKYILTSILIDAPIELGSYMIFYADGSGESNVGAEFSTFPAGHVTYTATEIIVQDQPDEVKLLVSADGKTITQTVNGEVAIVMTLESAIPAPTLITFTITDVFNKDTEYQAKEGMTWEQWVDSEYNTDGFRTASGNVGKDSYGISENSNFVSASDVIKANYTYQLTN